MPVKVKNDRIIPNTNIESAKSYDKTSYHKLKRSFFIHGQVLRVLSRESPCWIVAFHFYTQHQVSCTMSSFVVITGPGFNIVLFVNVNAPLNRATSWRTFLIDVVCSVKLHWKVNIHEETWLSMCYYANTDDMRLLIIWRRRIIVSRDTWSVNTNRIHMGLALQGQKLNGMLVCCLIRSLTFVFCIRHRICNTVYWHAMYLAVWINIALLFTGNED